MILPEIVRQATMNHRANMFARYVYYCLYDAVHQLFM